MKTGIATSDGTEKIIDYTAEEIVDYNARIEAELLKQPTRKLIRIKEIRLEKLKETDYLALGDVVLSDEVKAWRQSLRDIPANFSKSDYDDLLERHGDKEDDVKIDGTLKHSVWSKP